MEHREKEESSRVEGRNPVLEALRSGRSVDKVYIRPDFTTVLFRRFCGRPERGTPLWPLSLKSG